MNYLFKSILLSDALLDGKKNLVWHPYVEKFCGYSPDTSPKNGKSKLIYIGDSAPPTSHLRDFFNIFLLVGCKKICFHIVGEK